MRGGDPVSGFDRDALARAIDAHGVVARVVVTETRGSVPREVGTAMLVWPGGHAGTIGGGTLEFEAAARARGVLAGGADRIDRIALGPGAGQCCGGAVALLCERWDAARLARHPGPVIARPLPGEPEGAMPFALRDLAVRARGRGVRPALTIAGGWIAEGVAHASRALWVWGAGHVGRAVVAVMAPLPGVEVTWVDTAADRFPEAIPPGVTPRVAADLSRAARHAPPTAEHLIVTYSHAFDLALCHALLGHGFESCGLIGSATKWARFRRRLAALGHPPDRIARIRCPIGEPALGKHPQAIAIGVARAFLAGDASIAGHASAPARQRGA
jgi:xanthine dehydrogenase accessory factor